MATRVVEPGEQLSRTRLAVAVLYFCQGLCFATWASRIPEIKMMLQLSEAQLGSILFVMPVGQLLSLPLVGYLVEKYGSKWMTVASLLMYTAVLIGLGLSQTVWQLSSMIFLFGVAGNMFNISVNTQGVGVEKRYDRPIMSSFHGAWSLAGFCGALLGLLTMWLGWSTIVHFMTAAGGALLLLVLAAPFMLTEDRNVAGKRSMFSKPDKTLVLLGSIGFCSLAAEGAMFDWSGVYFSQVVMAPEALITLGYTGFMITMTMGRFLGDRLIARIGRLRIVRFSGFLIAAGLGISVFFPVLWAATIGFMLVGFGVSTMVPIIYSTAGKVNSTSPGVALATVTSISFLGFLIGPPLIGYIAHFLSLQYAFMTIALAGFIIVYLVSRNPGMFEEQ